MNARTVSTIAVKGFVQTALLLLPLVLLGCSSTEGVTTSAPPPSNPPPNPPPPAPGNDTTAPTVTLTAPANGATVSGTVTVSAQASDPTVADQTTSGVAGVQFRLNGVNLGAEDTTSPYSISWNTAAVANGSHTLTAVARDNAGNTKTSAAVTVTVANSSPPPPPPPPGGNLTIPSVKDEENTYLKWGWTWSASAHTSSVKEPIANYSIGSTDLHGDTEGDDLWTYLVMYQRSGNVVYYNRAKAWAEYFKRYRGSTEYQYDLGFLHDHMYGWGLLAWYEYTCSQSTCDTAALTAAEALAGDVEAYWSTRWNNGWPIPGQWSMGYYSLRQGARHLLLATRVAEVTGKARWITLRDKLLELWMKSPDWDARGMYFLGDWQTDRDLGAGSYAAGARKVSTFQIGILVEAYFNVWRITGRTDVRDRILAMAKYVDQYALEPNCQYAASDFGFVNGQPWWFYKCGGFWDPVYTTSLVNTLVLGYKITGERYYYDRAKHFFNRGTKGIYGSSTAREAPDNVVGHFVDTKFGSATGYYYLDYNRGELQYTYLIFENGGL